MPDRMGRPTFIEVLTAATNDFIRHGMDSEERLLEWLRQLRAAATRSLMPESQMTQYLRQAMGRVYREQVERGGLLRRDSGITRRMLERFRPDMRLELDRRIVASASLIKLNRVEETETTLRRFAGFATSIPAGGSEAIDKRKVSKELRKSMASLPYRERRVLIDQGHKLTAAMSEITAVGSAAIAGRWRSHWKQSGYDYRIDHKERDGEVFLVPGNWALEKGLMKRAGHKMIDQISKPGEEPFCRCWFEWIFNLRDLPRDMLTKAGMDSLKAKV